ncbi:Uncharacterised protein [Mycolicibacterium aurum]|uniref:Uncharacterized protein n=1 Tax=Mycolicibacterium aurum TaxID=1791 RepID=A0A3S4TRG2_MYCAU|nr:hypothetical protein [Mycolicibacterium aurum]VEG51019.1 Uncharacterised protein [Mycolicibacterium aurum]
MATRLALRGVELRYVITDHLFRRGPQSIPDIVDDLHHYGFEVTAPASKTVSDALRWEVRRGRLRRLRRGHYGPGVMPRGTEHRIYARAMALRAQAVLLTARDDEQWWNLVSTDW